MNEKDLQKLDKRKQKPTIRQKQKEKEKVPEIKEEKKVETADADEPDFLK